MKNFSPRFALAGATFAALVASTSSSYAQTPEQNVMVIEGAFTAPVGEPTISRFQPGGSLAVGGYHSLHPVFALGARLRGSLFGDGPAPPDRMLEDEGVGSLYTLSIAARLRPFGEGTDYARFTGLYLDVAAGAALTEDLVRPAFEFGIGYNFEAGDIGIGPVFRYQWVPHEGPIQDDHGHFLLFGVEVVLFDGRGTYVPEPAALVAAAPYDPCPGEEEDFDGFRDEDGCPDTDNDLDAILDVDDACPNQMETYNGYNDLDGCPDSTTLELVNDRIVIHDDVLFAFDEANIRPTGDRVIAELAALYLSHPEWTGMTVEGHADSRGTVAYNDELSERRAAAVRAALIAHGLAPAQVQIRVVGERRPQVPNAQTEEEHRANRVVIFTVQRTRSVTQTENTAPTDASPTSEESTHE